MADQFASFERRERPTKPLRPGDDDDGGGPSRPKVDRPETQDLMKRMRRVDPNQARRYRQRTGE